MPTNLTTRPVLARVSTTLLLAVLAMVLLPATSALADGPGYGGSADKLSVSWSSNGGVSASSKTFASAGPSLVVSGLGFRSRSPVVVQVGDHKDASARTDQVGQLRLAVRASGTGAAAPGTSVLASGRAPSGTTRILVGAIPPLPRGVGPMDVVPWLAGALVALWLTSRGLGRVRRQAGSKR